MTTLWIANDILARPALTIAPTLVHHHWRQGNIAVALPEPIHVNWTINLHPY
jgi:hypothetical protein